jgi:ADP-ribosylglycohydrolase
MQESMPEYRVFNRGARAFLLILALLGSGCPWSTPEGAWEGGGDVDTLGAMSGAIWGAANGATALPPQDLARLEQRERLSSVAAALYRASEG